MRPGAPKIVVVGAIPHIPQTIDLFDADRVIRWKAGRDWGQ